MQRAGAMRGKQVPLLFAYLVLGRDRPISREELSGALWPARAPANEDASLRTLLSRVRSALPGTSLTGRDELQLELPEPVWIDLEAATAEIERAQTALGRGDARGAWALAQVPLNIAARGLLPRVQAQWLEGRRRELEDVRLQALEIIGRAGLALGREQLPSVQRAARALIDAEPYRESGYLLLMEALAASGDQAEALRVFDRLRQLLREELGTPPSADAIAAHERLLSPSSPPPEQPSVEGGRLELPAQLQARGLLIGRSLELERLLALWGRTTGAAPAPARRAEDAAASRLVLVTGEAGIGKSRLVAEFAGRVHEEGAVVLAGRCSADALLPYQPFVEGLRHYVLTVPVASLRATAREYGGELARLLPELRRRVPELDEPAAAELETERYRLFEAVVGLLAEISARAPLLLFAEDLQWADRPTLLLLRHIARSGALRRVMVLGCLRGMEVSGETLREALGELRREGVLSAVELEGLREPHTAELVGLSVGGPPPAQLVRALQRMTEGNPFFVEEILRQLEEVGVDLRTAGPTELERVGLPDGVKEVLATRLARMGQPATEWLRAAAVIGREFDVALLEQVVSLGEEEFLTALEDALAAALVVEVVGRNGCYSFAHALIRETLYEGMSLPRRTRLHRRVGQALEAGPGSPQLAELALHFTRAADAEDAERAIGYARAAGQQATEMLAHEEAAEHFARALEVQERFRPADEGLRSELLLAVAEARVRAGERPLALAMFREAATLAAQRGDSRGLARAAIGASRRYIQPPGVVDEQLIALIRDALAFTEGERSVTRVALLGRMCGALYFSSARDELGALAAEATTIADELRDPEAQALAAAGRRRALWAPEHLEQRISDATELLTCGQQAGDVELVLQGHAWLVVDLLEQGDRAGVEAQVKAFTAGAERLRQPLYLWNAAVWRAMMALLEGRLDAAEQLAGEALALGAAGETVTAPQYYATQLLAIRREQARMAELEAPARQLAQANPNRAAWRAALAALLAETGRTEEARRELDALAADGFAGIPRDGDWLTSLALLADVAADLAAAEPAAALLDLLSPYAAANAVVGMGTVCLGSVSRCLGRLAATVGAQQMAAEHLERALEAESALGATVCLGHTRLEYARVLGPRSERAHELLRQAVRIAEELRLGKLLRRARMLGW